MGNFHFSCSMLRGRRASRLSLPRSRKKLLPEIEARGAAGALAFARRTFETDRDFQARRRAPRRDGRAGEAQADFFQHPSGLAAGEAAAFSTHVAIPTRCWARWRRFWAMKASLWKTPRRCWSLCWPSRACSPNALLPSRRRRTSNTGATVADNLAQYDIGQTVVDRRSRLRCRRSHGRHRRDDRARRARLCDRSKIRASTLSRALTVVKIAKPNQDMRFDVPVIGMKTIEVMKKAGATCLAVDAGACLFLDGSETSAAADAAGICVVCEE